MTKGKQQRRRDNARTRKREASLRPGVRVVLWERTSTEAVWTVGNIWDFRLAEISRKDDSFTRAFQRVLSTGLGDPNRRLALQYTLVK